MKKILFTILFLVFWVCAAAAQKTPAERIDQSLYVAQNTENAQTSSKEEKITPEQLPLPPAKISITTEKPVNGIPREQKSVSKTQEQSQIEPVDQKENIEQSRSTNIEKVTKNEQVPVETKNTVNTPLPLPDYSQPVKKEAEKVSTVTEKNIPLPVKKSSNLMEELNIYNVPTANFRTMKQIIDDNYNLRGMVYGEEKGYIHILEADDNGNFHEVWKSPPLNSPVRGLFVRDLDNDGEIEIITYTVNGNIYIYGYQSHDLIYKTPEGTYQSIKCMMIENMDRDPQLELFFIGVKPGTESVQGGELIGNLIQFDSKTQFEEWTSSDMYAATDMLFGNVDSDSEPEIILNTGEILGFRFKDIKWKIEDSLLGNWRNNRLYLIDLDDDGILELVIECDQSYIRIIDVDQRQEKW